LKRSPARTNASAVLLGGWLAAAGCAAAQPPAVLPRPFHVIAHRGASALAPENTLPAFARALELGVVEVELDAQLSRDGVPVLFHDGTLEGKTPLRGRVRDHPAEALLRADIGSWFDRTHPGEGRRWEGTRLTTLREVLETFGAKLRYHVELKDDVEATPARVIEIASETGQAERVMLTSFSRAQLERARRIDPRIPLCWLLKQAQPERIDEAAEAGFAMLGVHVRELTEALVRHAHSRGLEIRAFGVDTDAEMARAVALGSNGMTLDRPERLVSLLLERLRVRD
jgi:glycerophosphoryl diester phosphodiesterase